MSARSRRLGRPLWRQPGPVVLGEREPLWDRVGLLPVVMLLGLELTLALAILFGGTVASFVPTALPPPRPAAVARTTHVYAADGSLLASLHGEVNRRPIPLAEMPEHLRQAVVAAEDARFFRRRGALDPRSLVRALAANLRNGSPEQGGSTLTQQYVKQVYVGSERSLSRKVREARIALRVNRTMSKDQILEEYLNTVYFGRGAYGVQAAARAFFAKLPRDLTLSESSTLAAMIAAPDRYSPSSNPVEAEARRRWVIDRMEKLGFVTPQAAGDARAQTPGLAPDAPEPVRFPWFVDAVRSYLFDRYGSEAVLTGGLEVHTTLDPRLQQVAEELVRSSLPAAADPHAAVVSIDPATGYVRALVGGRDYESERYNLATQARRQPGSAFKPLVLVAALKKGMTPATTVGGMSLTEATAQSVNAVYMQLVRSVRPEAAVEAARAMGIPGPRWLPLQVGCRPLGSDVCRTVIQPVPALALGSEEVTPLEMASAFSTLAAGGTHRAPKVVAKVVDGSDNVLEEGPSEPRAALAPSVANAATQVLSQVITRGTGRRAEIGRPAAGKTGTAQDYGNAWFVGYTRELATAVWMGYPEANRPLVNVQGVAKVAGGTIPAEIWGQYMRAGDLSVALSVPTTPVLLGQDLTYTIRASNAGPWAAGDVSADNALPAGAKLVSARPSQGSCSQRRSTLTCDLGEVRAQGTVSVDVVVRPAGPGVVTTAARVVAGSFDPTPANDSASVQMRVDPAADLSVTAAPRPTHVLAGEQASYTVTVNNRGPSPASDVTLMHRLPPGMVLVSAGGPHGPCRVGEAVRCSVRSLRPGGRAAFHLVVTPMVAGTLGSVITVSAREADPQLADNEARANLAVIPTADLEVAQSASPERAVQGQPVTYQVSVRNRGPSPAMVVTVTHVISGDVKVISATTTSGTCKVVGAAVICELPHLEPGSTVGITVVVEAHDRRAITSAVTATGRDIDLLRPNNTAKLTTRIAPAADLSLTVTTPASPPSDGQELRFTITVTNRGPAPATAVSVSQKLPASVRLVWARPRACSQAREVLTCRLRRLAPGASATLTVALRPAAQGTLATQATVGGREADPDPANNAASASVEVQPRPVTPTRLPRRR